MRACIAAPESAVPPGLSTTNVGNSHGRIRCLCLQYPEHALDGREDILGLDGFVR